jgi:hypothetical protein
MRKASSAWIVGLIKPSRTTAKIAILFLAYCILASMENTWMAQASDPPFRVEFTKQADQAFIASEENGPGPRTVLEIRSQTGIGGCVVRRNGTIWPDRLTVRFNLRGLEHVVVQIGDRKWQGSVTSHDGSIRWTRRDEGGPEVSIQTDQPEWCPIRVVESQQTVPIRVPLADTERWELTLPKHWLDANPEIIRLDWIDFYR